MKLSKKTLHILLIIYIAITVLIGANYIFQGSIRFDADISRDFLLLDELVTKKYMLIGPRASGIPGVFHGPLWIYLNLPAYILGNTNPVVVGFGWIVFILLFLTASYFLIRKISDTFTAIAFTGLSAGVLIVWYHQLLNPFGAFALMPILVFFLWKYTQKQLLKYWLALILILGAMIQFQMAVGGPITILTLFWVFKIMWHKKKLKQLVWLPLFAIPLSTFIIFELRHDFAQTQSVLKFISGNTNAQLIPLSERLLQRWKLFTRDSISLFYHQFRLLNVPFALAFMLQVKNNIFVFKPKKQQLFNLIFYLYLGYFLITLFFNGYLLIYYWWPLVPLSLLMTSMILSQLKSKLKYSVLTILLLSQLWYGYGKMQEIEQGIGVIEDDWLFQKIMVEKLFQGEEQEFGYFIFTPDVFAYESKAAMTYTIAKHPEKSVIRYKKMPITYLILAPRDKIREDVNSDRWKDQRLKLDPKDPPAEVMKYLDGYTIEKFEFSEAQLNQEPDPTIDDWLHFR